jgi:hypothetical protein
MRPQAWQVLVIADKTLESPELTEAILARRSEHPRLQVTLLVPTSSPQRERTELRLARAMTRLGAAGAVVVGVLGDSIAAAAVKQTWDPMVYDEVIVSTLPASTSRWLRIGLPQQVAAMTGAPVDHVVARQVVCPAAHRHTRSGLSRSLNGSQISGPARKRVAVVDVHADVGSRVVPLYSEHSTREMLHGHS